MFLNEISTAEGLVYVAVMVSPLYFSVPVKEFVSVLDPVDTALGLSFVAFSSTEESLLAN